MKYADAKKLATQERLTIMQEEEKVEWEVVTESVDFPWYVATTHDGVCDPCAKVRLSPKAHAALIAHKWNHFDEMLEALRHARRHTDNTYDRNMFTDLIDKCEEVEGIE